MRDMPQYIQKLSCTLGRRSSYLDLQGGGSILKWERCATQPDSGRPQPQAHGALSLVTGGARWPLRMRCRLRRCCVPPFLCPNDQRCWTALGLLPAIVRCRCSSPKKPAGRASSGSWPLAFEGETDPALASLVDEIVWLKVGQLSQDDRPLHHRGVKQCVMAGQIAPKNLFDSGPTSAPWRLLLRLKEKNAHTIFGAIADELKQDGVELIEATPWLRPRCRRRAFQLGPEAVGGAAGGRRVWLSHRQGGFPAGNRPDRGGQERHGSGR